MKIPSNEEMTLKTERLVLDPVEEAHAEDMIKILSTNSLYRYVPATPPSLEELSEKYKEWESRVSPDDDEIWLNWIARDKKKRKPIGHFQATIRKEDGVAMLGYTVGLLHQRQGYAFEALTEVCTFLKNVMAVSAVRAAFDSENEPSRGLLEKLGMKQIEFNMKADFFKGSDSDEYVYEL